MVSNTDPNIPRLDNTRGIPIENDAAKQPEPATGDSNVQDVILKATGNEKSYTIDNQGNVVISDKGGNSFTFSLNANNPTLSPPKGSQNVLTLTPNEWFSVSFMAVFTTIMAQLASALSRIRYAEGQEVIKARIMEKEVAETKATLIKTAAHLEAQKHIANAVTSFATAGMSAVSLVMTTTAMYKAKEDANVKAAEKKMMDSENDFKMNKFEALATNEKNPPSFEQFKKNPDAYPGILKSEAYQQYKQAQSNYDQKLHTQEQLEVSKVRSMEQIVRGIADGSNAAAQATFTELKGTVDSFIQMFELYGKVLQDFANTSQRSRDDLTSAFNEAIRALKETVSKDYQAFSRG